MDRIRQELILFQRNFAHKKLGAVLDGRDIGSVIFPNAQIKFFVTADLAVRAQRRNEQYKNCLLYTSPSPRDATLSRMPSSA